MYGVLYAISPEIFPAKDRGTGNALTATATRVFGVIVSMILFYGVCENANGEQAPIIALYADLATAVPVYISGALILFAAGLALLIPFEPRGKTSL
jgi:MFS family permease